ncbi:hypothetical protein KTT_11170 [Tengunoibacter tsumagoiensis]|uniref:Uncharacterized protein n=1 Tax=Tengunoibacter tsumagoiensis TaxID=2014871 RepID=A0A401ZWK8_9CHLR|nr:hypothetical protein KTT_11170 [Tengunoibacter tsumagoiensis]
MSSIPVSIPVYKEAPLTSLKAFKCPIVVVWEQQDGEGSGGGRETRATGALSVLFHFSDQRGSLNASLYLFAL